MNLIIDQGNTLCKLALFKNDQLVASKKNDGVVQIEELLSFLNSIEKVSEVRVILSSVIQLNDDLIQRLCEIGETIILSKDTPLPIQVDYQTPESLGADRLALAVGASNNEEVPVLVIDVGTCITYDFVTDEKTYKGGAISPGINLRFRALNAFTNKLPLVTIQKNIELIGASTEACINSGVVLGIEAELDGIISAYLTVYPNLKVYLTGGDHQLFDNRLKNSTFADQNLLLKGLNTILNFNETI